MSTKEQILSDREKALQFDETKRTLKDLEYENKILKAKIEKIKSILDDTMLQDCDVIARIEKEME